MEELQYLTTFFSRIETDPRIGAFHVSVFCAVFKFGCLQQCFRPVLVVSKEVMTAARISGLTTYHRCIRDLNDYGYIDYRPSYNHRKKSKVFFQH